MQYLLRYAIFKPILENGGFELQISDLHFFLLCLATVMIAAAGNVINDYFDIKIDRINRPERLVVGNIIKRRVAMGAHMTINFIGLMIGILTSFILDLWANAIIFVVASAMLWLYSVFLKKKILLGNLIIALLAAFVPIVVAMYDIPSLEYFYESRFEALLGWTLVYAFFAFFFTLAREITKDIADIKGDEACRCRTLPIVLGPTVAKYTIIFIYMFSCFWLYYLQQNTFLNETTTLAYMILFIIAPTAYMGYITYKGQVPADFNKASMLNKLVSLAAVLYMVVAYFMILNNGPLF